MSTGMFSSRRLFDEWRGVRGGVSTRRRAVDDAMGGCPSVVRSDRLLIPENAC